MPHNEASKSKIEIEHATTLLTEISNEVNIRRIDRRPEQISITCLVRFDGINDMENFSKGFDENFPEGSFTLIDDSSFPNE